MRKYDRRTFLKTSVGAIAAATCLPALGQAPLTATSLRTLGKSGLSCTLLGIGTGTRGRDDHTTDQTRLPGGELVKLLEYAYDRGITYFDMADRYGSHPYMKQALKNSIPRDKVLLLSNPTSAVRGQILAKPAILRFISPTE